MGVLVIGAFGFVGSALVKRLSDAGEEVVGIVRDSPVLAHPDSAFYVLPAPKKASIAAGDVLDTDFVYRVLVEYDVRRVFHVAAHSAVSKCQKDPLSAWKVNALGTVSVLEACRRYGKVEAIVTASTDKVYGSGPVPYVEDQRLEGIDPYAASKVAADTAARSYAITYGLPVNVVRSCNVFGPGDLEFTRLIPGSIKRMLEGNPAVLYNDAAHMIREFVYIDDEVDAYLMLSERTVRDIVYNVGGSGPVSVGHVMKKLADLCGGRIDYMARDFLEIPEQHINDNRLRLLGWEPKVPLDEGLRKTVDWFRWYFSVTSAAH